MAIDFPASPTNGQTHTVGSTTWTWDGVKWGITSGAAGATDKIEEGNTSAEVIDTGSDGRFVVTTEGTERLRVENNGSTQIRSGSELRAYRSDNTRYGRLYTDNNATVLEANTSPADPLSLRSAERFDVQVAGTERMRIGSDGVVLIGKTSDVLSNPGWAIRQNGTSQLATNVAGGPVLRLNHTGATSTEYLIETWKNGAQVGSISVTSSATAYNTSSDYRLKENVTPVADGIARLQQLKPSRFNFVADPDKTVDGFIAHEVQSVVPEAITGEKDAVNDEGDPIYQGIDQSKLVPLLTAALQEAIARIEAQDTTIASLEARLTALEGGN